MPSKNAQGKRSGRGGAAARRLKLLELRKTGVPYREIGQSQGISEARAHRDVAASLERMDELQKEVAGELRALELERLDDVYRAVHKRLRGKTLLQAADRLIRIVERRCKLLGLDAPEIVEHASGVTVAQMEELSRRRWLEIAPIMAQLNAQGGWESPGSETPETIDHEGPTGIPSGEGSGRTAEGERQSAAGDSCDGPVEGMPPKAATSPVSPTSRSVNKDGVGWG